MREITRVADLDDLGVFASQAYADLEAAILAHRTMRTAMQYVQAEHEDAVTGSQDEYNATQRRLERVRHNLQKADAERYRTMLVFLTEVQRKQQDDPATKEATT